MPLHQTVFLCVGHLVLCSVSLFLCFFVWKWNLKFKFSICLVILSVVTFSTSAFLTHKEFTLIRFLIAAAVVGPINHSCTLWFITNLITPINEINKSLESLSRGNFNVKMEIKSRDEFRQINERFNQMIAEMSILISSIKNTSIENFQMAENLLDLSAQMSENAAGTSQKASTVSEAAINMNASMTAVASAMQQASKSMEMVASAIEENTATINTIARNSEESRAISDEAVSQGLRASKRVAELGKAAQDVSKITEAITEISEQTNLLALNATIEAARAGESGKGFAVVAAEIKELARQTADATHEITSLIAGIQGSAKETITDIETITNVINKGNQIISNIASEVEEQTVTTKNIANNVSQTSMGLHEISENVSKSLTVSKIITRDISDVNQDAEKNSVISARVKENAEILSELAGRLQTGTAKFMVLETGRS